MKSPLLFAIALVALACTLWSPPMQAAPADTEARILSKPVTVTFRSGEVSLLHPDRVFRKVAAAAGVNLIAQFYRKPSGIPGASYPRSLPVSLPPRYQSVSLGRVLQDVCNWAGYSFELHGSTLILQNRTRYRDDLFQIDLDLDRQIRSYKNPNHLAFQAFLASDRFNDRQRYLLSSTYSFLGNYRWSTSEIAAMELYALLDVRQRREVARNGRLPYDALDGKQKDVVNRWFQSEGWYEDPKHRKESMLIWNATTPDADARPKRYHYVLDTMLVKDLKLYVPPEGQRPKPWNLSPYFPLAGKAVTAVNSTKEGLFDVKGGRITVQAPAIKIGQLLRTLSPLSSHRVSAAPGIADRTVAVWMRSVTEKEILASLARVWGFRWKPSGKGAVLYQSEGDRKRELARRQWERETELTERSRTCSELPSAVEYELYKLGDKDIPVPPWMKQSWSTEFYSGTLLPDHTKWAIKVLYLNGKIPGLRAGKPISLSRDQIPAALLNELKTRISPQIQAEIDRNRVFYAQRRRSLKLATEEIIDRFTGLEPEEIQAQMKVQFEPQNLLCTNDIPIRIRCRTPEGETKVVLAGTGGGVWNYPYAP